MKFKEPIKVLQIGMTYNWGGLETYLMQQFDNIDKTKVIYDFVNITAEKEIVFADKIRNSGSKIFETCSRHKNPLKHYWQWVNILRKYGKEYKAIVLNTNSLEYVFPIFIAKIFGVPIRAVHSHSTGFERKIGLLRKILVSFNRVLLKWSVTNYFACSKKSGEWMYGKSRKFTVIHNAINVENYVFNNVIRNKLREDLNIRDCFVLGHVGRFSYPKNHEFLIKVFSEVVKIKKNARLLLVGDYVDNVHYWELSKYLVKDFGIEDKVLFLGLRNDVPEILQAMDCFVLPSIFEGLPLVGIEAQTAGLPCFFADTITDELGITDLAHYISLNDTPENWALKICLCNGHKRVDMSEVIKEANYDIKNEIKKVELLYIKS